MVKISIYIITLIGCVHGLISCGKSDSSKQINLTKDQESVYKVLLIAGSRIQNADWALALYGANKKEIADIKTLYKRLPEIFVNHPEFQDFVLQSTYIDLSNILIELVNRHSLRMKSSNIYSIFVLNKYLAYHSMILSDFCFPTTNRDDLTKLPSSELTKLLEEEQDLCSGANGNQFNDKFPGLNSTKGGNAISTCLQNFTKAIEESLKCENQFAEGDQETEEGEGDDTKINPEIKCETKEECENEKKKAEEERKKAEEERKKLTSTQGGTQEEQNERQRKINLLNIKIDELNKRIGNLGDLLDAMDDETDARQDLVYAGLKGLAGLGLAVFAKDQNVKIIGAMLLGDAILDVVRWWQKNEKAEELSRNLQECFEQNLSISLGKGVKLNYLVSGSKVNNPNPSIKRPPGLNEILDYCLCEAMSPTEGTNPVPGGKAGEGLSINNCLSEEDRKRMDCLANPYGPDDAPKRECLTYLKEDMKELLKDKGCELMTCPESQISVTFTSGLNKGKCACVSRKDVSDRISNNGGCLSMDCPPGQDCVCPTRNNCNCSSGPVKAVVDKKTISLAPNETFSLTPFKYEPIPLIDPKNGSLNRN